MYIRDSNSSFGFNCGNLVDVIFNTHTSDRAGLTYPIDLRFSSKISEQIAFHKQG